MADKEKKENSEGQEESGSKKKLIIIIAAALVVLLLGGGAAFYFLVLKKPPPEEKTPEQKVELAVPAATEEADIGPMLDIKEFIVNIISEEGTHYVKAALTLELNNEVALEEANKRLPQIRDAIILLISNKTFEELQDLQGKKQLKAELKSKINSFLKSGKVKNIYLTDFVVQ
ncbi:flagellar basal body-associated protein FliL [Desulfolithobacter dissulfuricans]|uniref:Flagellar protein FliL n=1 Tax=Desulfolithobacter dissulfuricans TaxID=2795293 RepID=A0A915XHD2_9BACT|nr:flagellar basal body-associated FliL family protein [Desulfolithobacter dissulfuricans]BCO08539.1 flagellar basal body-associated protein FliL [Desulfolithobacter dissulfuricans]